MNYKTSKILSIITRSIILIAFFMPWTKSMYGIDASAWDMVEQLFSILTNAKRLPEDIRAYLPFILVALPISSVVVMGKFKKRFGEKTREPFKFDFVSY